MKYIVIFVITLLGEYLTAQTIMSNSRNIGRVKIWDIISSGGDTLGSTYSIESEAEYAIVFAPVRADLADANLAMTGTYTAQDGRVAGRAYNQCSQVGNSRDKRFKPNAWLISERGKIKLSTTPSCTAVQVYKVVDDNNVLDSIISSRTKTPQQWRFFVEKKWVSKHSDGTIADGVDIIIVDFTKFLTLHDASMYVQGLKRNITYVGFSFHSFISACLLDTGSFRPYLVQGVAFAGDFLLKQSNVIIVK